MELRDKICGLVDAKADCFVELNDKIWATPELDFKETKSAAALIEVLKAEGFQVEEGIAGIPTAFVGSWGSGRPIIGILGEFDALPGLSQKAGCPVKEPVVEGGNGHGCGHCALGSGSLAAAVAVKDYMKETGMTGTIRFYGCPAEEHGCGKTFMTREGVFDELDAALTWHPGDSNSVWGISSLANRHIHFHFKGKTAHAAAAPQLGRSALDACELMNVGVNYLREHIIPEARIHYAYLDVGGDAPNVVQGTATTYYMIRAPKIKQVLELCERVFDIARGAALMTGTEVSWEIKQGLCDYIPNKTLSELAAACMAEVGAPAFDEADYQLARQFRATLTEREQAAPAALVKAFGAKKAQEIADGGLCNVVLPYVHMPEIAMPGSTDVGDVSYAIPTAQMGMATAAIGTGAHTWQMTAQVGSSIGHKGMLAVGKALALTAVRLFQDPSIIERAKEEHKQNAPEGYLCPVPDDVKPSL